MTTIMLRVTSGVTPTAKPAVQDEGYVIFSRTLKVAPPSAPAPAPHPTQLTVRGAVPVVNPAVQDEGYLLFTSP